MRILLLCEQAKLFKMQHISKVISGVDCNWVTLAQAIITSVLKSGPHKKERQGWSVVEALLLTDALMIKASPRVKGLWAG